MTTTRTPPIDVRAAATDADARAEDARALPRSPTLRILHVEDNSADALLMQEYLRGAVGDVTFDPAVRLADLTVERAEASDCALLDLSLPDASGLEALTALRGMSDALPIIVLTGFDDLSTALDALRFGADDYLIKNHVDGQTLARALRYGIERRRLALLVASEAAAATLAVATLITSQAAAAEAVDRPAQPAQPMSAAMVGTHEVSVRIDEQNGEYVLSCASCSWEADRGADAEHSWAERSLESALLHHVAFGGDSEDESAAFAEAEASLDEPRVELNTTEAVSRRTMLDPESWV